jgi:hypothetical protein
MNCQYESCDARKWQQDAAGNWGYGEGREATVLTLSGPRKQQTPACEECARYWMNTMTGLTWLAPLSSYVDNYATARAQLAAYEAAQARQAAGGSIPAPSADHPHPVSRACDDLCRVASFKPQRAIQGSVVPSPSQSKAAPLVPQAGKKESPAPAIAMGVAAAIIAGLVMTIAGLPDGTQIGSQPNLAILLPGLALLLGFPAAGIIVFIRSIRQANRRWLSQLPPGQRERVRKAQNYAMGVAALGAVDLGLRAANKHTSANTAAMQAAKQRRRAQAEGQQRHQELLDAIQQGGQGQGPQGLQPKHWIPPGTQ